MTKAHPTLQIALGGRLREVREALGWSQDQMAKRARDCGLNWTRSALAKVERGERDVRLGEFLLLPAVTRLTLDTLFTAELDSWIQLTPRAAATTETLRNALAARKVSDSSLDYDLPMHRTHNRPSATEKARDRERLALFRALFPKLDFSTYYRAVTVSSDADRKAAHALAQRTNRDLTPEHVVLLSFGIWDGRTLTEERDRRIGDRAVNAGGLAAARGHITRRLVQELSDALVRIAPAGTFNRREK